MLAKFAVILTAALAVAAQTTSTTTTTINQCNTGSLQCCQSVESSKTPAAQKALGLVDVLVGQITAQVGLTCNPINVIGISGNSCSAQPACCKGDNFNGAVVLGCDPVNLNV